MADKKIRTAIEALALWDAGEPIPAFEVESEVNEQETLWGAAFDRIARRKNAPPPIPFTKRERVVIDSIVFVAQKIGWYEMVRRHIHERSPSITIRKPAATRPPAPPVPSIASGPAGVDDPAGLLPDLSEQVQKQAKSQETAPPGSESTPGPLPGAQSDLAVSHVGEPKEANVDNARVTE